MEEHLFDANSEVYDTFLEEEIIEAAKGKLEVRKNGVWIPMVFLSLYFIFSLSTKPPSALNLLSGAQRISLSPKELS